jgi:phosphinothricin acetyltransferase
VQIRLAQAADAPAIAAIYNQGVGTTASFDLRPRSLDEQEEWLAERSGVFAAIVIEAERGTVAGFASLSPYRSRPAYSTTVEDSIYIDEDHQGQGLGRRLLDELLRLAQIHGFHSVIARIGGGNEASIALHRAVGFELVGVEREVGRKFNRWIDVTEMQKLLNESPI